MQSQQSMQHGMQQRYAMGESWEPCTFQCSRECCCGWCCPCLQVPDNFRTAHVPDTETTNITNCLTIIWVIHFIGLDLHLCWPVITFLLGEHRNLIAKTWPPLPTADFMDYSCYCCCWGCQLGSDFQTCEKLKNRHHMVGNPVGIGSGHNSPAQMGPGGGGYR